MDSFGTAVWKWYGTTPNNTSGEYGRSASWSSVEPFHSYVENNQGFGLVAQADAPYYSGEEGDILHLGPVGFWKHTVIISDVIKDDNGNTLDYLVNSNTADLRNYPAGAYAYTYQSLVHIFGWND